MLALVCLVKEDNFDRQNLIDYYIDIFKDGVKQIFQAHEKMIKSEEVKSEIIELINMKKILLFKFKL